MNIFHGIPASWGIGIGPARIIKETLSEKFPVYEISASDVQAEWNRFLKAVESAKKDISALEESASPDEKLIFQSHNLMLSDPEVLKAIRERLETQLQNVEKIVFDLSREYSNILANSGDPYLKERSADIEDAYDRVIEFLTSKTRDKFKKVKKGDIVCAKSIKPSDVATLKEKKVAGFILETGGTTSHTAILARGYRIPCVMGVRGITEYIQNNETCIINGQYGVVLSSPDEETMNSYQGQKQADQERVLRQTLLRKKPCCTKDGCQCNLLMNAGLPKDVKQALEELVPGIGLFRSEYVFIQKSEEHPEYFFISEEEQYESYSYVLKAMGKKSVTIRTLDVGGDKMFPGQDALGEKNPLLGWRGIRFSLAQPEIFKTQIKALLRASVTGNLKIMFPLISSLDEFLKARNFVNQVADELKSKNIPIAENIKIGTMIETPAAAVCADQIAKYSDFFSIGTNDLIQYCMAIDRENENVASLYDPCNPAVIRLLKNITDAGIKNNIPVSVCGEIAGLPEMVFLMLGMGLRTFSMNAAALGQIREMITKVWLSDAESAFNEILKMDNGSEISKYINSKMKESINRN